MYICLYLVCMASAFNKVQCLRWTLKATVAQRNNQLTAGLIGFHFDSSDSMTAAVCSPLLLLDLGRVGVIHYKHLNWTTCEPLKTFSFNKILTLLLLSAQPWNSDVLYRSLEPEKDHSVSYGSHRLQIAIFSTVDQKPFWGKFLQLHSYLWKFKVVR